MGGAGKGKEYSYSLAERYVPPFAEKWGQVGPKHKAWQQRVKLEIISLSRYLNFLKADLPRPWFQLKPDPDPKYNFCIWRGFLQIPQRPEIKFRMVILLSSEFPKVIPRCFLEDRVAEYCGKIYTKNIWKDAKDNGRPYIMICHDHMAEVEGAWAPNLGICHFFIREVWYWFAANQGLMIQATDNRKKWDSKAIET
jgi:hypothetical protein